MDDVWNSTLRIAIVDADRVASGNGFLPVYVGDRQMGSARIEKRGEQMKVVVPGGAQHEQVIMTKRINPHHVCFICPTCRRLKNSLHLTYASSRAQSTAFECRGCACKTREHPKQKKRLA